MVRSRGGLCSTVDSCGLMMMYLLKVTIGIGDLSQKQFSADIANEMKKITETLAL